MRKFGMTIVFFGVGTTLSIACDCAPSEYIDDKQILLEAVHEADLVIEGNPIFFEIVESAGNEPIAIAKFKVLKCVKGECGSEVTIKTSAGNLGANCGMDFKIEAAFKNKETAWLSAYYFEDKDSKKKTL